MDIGQIIMIPILHNVSSLASGFHNGKVNISTAPIQIGKMRITNSKLVKAKLMKFFIYILMSENFIIFQETQKSSDLGYLIGSQ